MEQGTLGLGVDPKPRRIATSRVIGTTGIAIGSLMLFALVAMPYKPWSAVTLWDAAWIGFCAVLFLPWSFSAIADVLRAVDERRRVLERPQISPIYHRAVKRTETAVVMASMGTLALGAVVALGVAARFVVTHFEIFLTPEVYLIVVVLLLCMGIGVVRKGVRFA